jgi:hypothetical protein
MPSGSTTIAVFTGDVVRSSRLAPGALDAVMAVLDRAVGEAAGWGGGAARFTRFRGDGWQALAPSPALALRAALYVKARLRAEGRGYETRVAIGIGAGAVPGPGARGADGLAAAGGAAFRIAGHGLDTMARPARLAIGWDEPPACAGPVAAIVGLVDAISARWTPAQAAAIAPALAPERATQATVAARLGITQQTVAQHMRAGSEWAVLGALAAVEGGDAS